MSVFPILNYVSEKSIINLIPDTTLFLLQSLDGKISNGTTDNYDFDKDFPKIGSDVSAGLYQYYDIEQTTELWSAITGRTAVKIGCNKNPNPDKTIVNFVVIDNYHLNEIGCKHWTNKSNICVLITYNPKHPMFKIKDKYNNIKIILLNKNDTLKKGFIKLKELDCEAITIQTGGTLNGELFNLKLINHIDIVVAPIIIANNDCMSIADNKQISYDKVRLKLNNIEILKNSYIRLKYDIDYK